MNQSTVLFTAENTFQSLHQHFAPVFVECPALCFSVHPYFLALKAEGDSWFDFLWKLTKKSIRLCFMKRDVYTPLEKRNKCILISVKWYDCFCIKKKSVKKMTVFGNQSSKFMYRKSSYVQKNKSQKWKEHTYNVLNILIVSVISTV